MVITVCRLSGPVLSCLPVLPCRFNAVRLLRHTTTSEIAIRAETRASIAVKFLRDGNRIFPRRRKKIVYAISCYMQLPTQCITMRVWEPVWWALVPRHLTMTQTNFMRRSLRLLVWYLRYIFPISSPDRKAPTGLLGKYAYSSRTTNEEPPCPRATARRKSENLDMNDSNPHVLVRANRNRWERMRVGVKSNLPTI